MQVNKLYPLMGLYQLTSLNGIARPLQQYMLFHFAVQMLHRIFVLTWKCCISDRNV